MLAVSRGSYPGPVRAPHPSRGTVREGRSCRVLAGWLSRTVCFASELAFARHEEAALITIRPPISSSTSSVAAPDLKVLSATTVSGLWNTATSYVHCRNHRVPCVLVIECFHRLEQTGCNYINIHVHVDTTSVIHHLSFSAAVRSDCRVSGGGCSSAKTC